MRYMTLLLCNTLGVLLDVQSSMDYSEAVFCNLMTQKNLLIKTLSFHMIVLCVIEFKQNDFFQCEICGNCVTEGLNTLKATFCKPIFVSLQNLMCV